MPALCLASTLFVLLQFPSATNADSGSRHFDDTTPAQWTEFNFALYQHTLSLTAIVKLANGTTVRSGTLGAFALNDGKLRGVQSISTIETLTPVPARAFFLTVYCDVNTKLIFKYASNASTIVDVHTTSPWAFTPNAIIGDLERPYVFSLPSQNIADVTMMLSPLPPSLPSPLSRAPLLLGAPSMAPLTSLPTPSDGHKIASRRSPNRVWSTGASAATVGALLLLITAAIYAHRQWKVKGQKRRSSSAPLPASVCASGDGRPVVRICHPKSATQGVVYV